MKNFIQNPNQKVVITFDGNQTLARIYEDNKVVAKGISTCAPEDEFDLVCGSNLALTRAMEAMKPTLDKQEWVVVKRLPRKGDYIRIIKKGNDFDEIGDILKVHDVGATHPEMARVLISDHPKCEDYLYEATGGWWLYDNWLYEADLFEIIEPAPEKPKFRKITRAPKVGDYVKVISSSYGDIEKPDTMYKIGAIDVACIGVKHSDHPDFKKLYKDHNEEHMITNDFIWWHSPAFNTMEFYEKV